MSQRVSAGVMPDEVKHHARLYDSSSRSLFRKSAVILHFVLYSHYTSGSTRTRLSALSAVKLSSGGGEGVCLPEICYATPKTRCFRLYRRASNPFPLLDIALAPIKTKLMFSWVESHASPLLSARKHEVHMPKLRTSGNECPSGSSSASVVKAEMVQLPVIRRESSGISYIMVQFTVSASYAFSSLSSLSTLFESGAPECDTRKNCQPSLATSTSSVEGQITRDRISEVMWSPAESRRRLNRRASQD
nr:hypothetical protein CFP56_03759 [Quercus suber]